MRKYHNKAEATGAPAQSPVCRSHEKTLKKGIVKMIEKIKKINSRIQNILLNMILSSYKKLLIFKKYQCFCSI